MRKKIIIVSVLERKLETFLEVIQRFDRQQNKLELSLRMFSVVNIH